MSVRLSRRGLLKAGGALVVSLAFDPLRPLTVAAQAAAADRFLGKPLAGDAVDAFLSVNADGSVTVFAGKVDLGTGARIALRQIAAEELDVPIGAIALIEGDTALTPDQGPTAGSQGITRGGAEIRRAAATARQALVRLAAERLDRPVEELEVADGVVRPRAGGPGVRYADLVGGQRLELQVDPKVPVKRPEEYRLVGKPLPRPDVPAKVTGRHVFVHDLALPGMLHARVIRPPAVRAQITAVDEPSIASIPGARVVRIENFVAVAAESEWAAVRAARRLKVAWATTPTLPAQATLFAELRRGPFVRDQTTVNRGDAGEGFGRGRKTLDATYEWPMQTHGSMGPSCAVADVKPERTTIWTASQAPHRFQSTLARLLGLPRERVRIVYLDGAGCYGMNGHDDAAADAALLSKTLGRPVRVQWSREDEHGWDPKGPPQLLDIRAALDEQGEVVAWETQAWLPLATAGLPNMPLLAPRAAGIEQPLGLSTGLIFQNIDPPYDFPNVRGVIHWLKDAPLRPSNIRAPGKVANSFAVESFVDELAWAAGQDPLAFRLQHLKHSRGVEVLRRVGARMAWAPRPAPRRADATARVPTGRGVAYVHYKHSENHVAIGMEVAVERATGRVRVTRVVCAHDCGLMINPDCVKSQIEGNILQTLSRTLFEEVTFDRFRVTSVDWASYPILTFPDVPALEIDLVERPTEPPLGVGEAASTPVPAALANAIFDATGLRLRSVPFTPARLKAALARA
jgi:CO/xanthine dehydrogenase Mo-binding subunit